ncbi:MAG: histidine-type phosphatase, partial [Prevotella sp.]|nr:histidine-type phosphatase [Prevotella sp.]
MRKLTTILLLAAFALSSNAQTAREEIKANRYLSASNYVDYDNYPATKALTPAPAGYEPYLMNHYGRHGARWLIDPASYTRPLKILRQADSLGILTAEGKDVLRQVEAVYASSIQRLGELTTVGERQHHGIGKRMVEHFPDLFKTPGLPVDARSTVVIRCILSMEAECEELAAANPSIRWHNDVSESLQYYLNQPQTPYMKALRKKTRELRRELNRKVERGMDTSRFTNLLFTNPQLAKDSIGAGSLIHEIFDVVSNMQSHDLGLDLYPYFTADELYYLWRIRNIGW